MRIVLRPLTSAVIAVGAGASDHLANEAGKEQHHAEHHCKQCQIKERLIGNGAEVGSVCLADQLRDDDPDRHHEADQEHKDARIPEEMHRFLAEST